MRKTALGAAEAGFRYGGGTLIDGWYEVRSLPPSAAALWRRGGGRLLCTHSTRHGQNAQRLIVSGGGDLTSYDECPISKSPTLIY